jgi:tetratricopeptide (TPR) repeat protein
MLLAVWPMLAADLPLATPLGALPVAAAFAVALPGRRSTRLPGWLPALAALLGLGWAFLVTAGYAQLRSGRSAAAIGDHVAAAKRMELSQRLIPFEERCSLYLAASRYAQGAFMAAAEAAEGFNSVYPGYWRGQELEGRAFLALGRPEEAAGAFMAALRLAPPDSSRAISRLSVAALGEIPSDPEDRLVLARALLDHPWIPPGYGRSQCLGAADAILELADSLPAEDPEVAELRRHANRFMADAELRGSSPEED